MAYIFHSIFKFIVEMILLAVSYERKNIIFYEKNLKLTKHNTFNNVFYNRIFPYNFLLPIFLKMIELSSIISYFLGENIPYNYPVFNFEYKVFSTL